MNHYATLGVPNTATPDAITTAYRALSLKHHPDRQGGDAALMSLVNAAYEVLSDPVARAAYDAGGAGDEFQAKVQGEIRGIFQRAVGAILEGHKIPNIVRDSVTQLGTAIAQLQGTVRDTKRQRERAEALRARISHMGGGGVYQEVLEKELADIDAHEAAVEGQIHLLEAVRVELQTYTDNVSLVSADLRFPEPKTR